MSIAAAAPAATSADLREHKRVRLLTTLEWLLAAVILCGLIVAHWRFRQNAGGLWRDEVNSVNVATSPSFEVLWDRVKYDLYPPLWVLFLRVWSGGTDLSDAQWRNLGWAIGLLVLTAIVLQALVFRRKSISRSAPLWTLAAVAAHPIVVCFGDSLRAHGIGLLLMVGMFISIWRVVENANVGRILTATVVSSAAAFASYYNCLLLLSLCLAGMTTVFVNGRRRLLLVLPGVGLAAAVVLFGIYGRQIAASSAWRDLQRMPLSELAPFTRWLTMLQEAGTLAPWFWGAMVLVAAVGLIAEWRNPQDIEPLRSRTKTLFLGGCLVIAPLVYGAFLLVVQFVTGAWYFLMLTAFLGLCLDHALAHAIDCDTGSRWVRLLVIGGLFGVTVPALQSQVNLRMTNVDLAAQRLEQIATPDDLIIVNSWWLAIPFDRYYHGPTPWTTVPEVSEHKVMRYDLIKQRMTEENPTASAFAKIEQTLRSGNRVFVVGSLVLLPKTEPRPMLPPAPQAPTGWQEHPYLNQWTIQLTDLTSEHSTVRNMLPIPTSGPIRSQEEVDLFLFRDWAGKRPR